ncbi:MAG TPA: hypothetical protein VOA87_11005, partial [Thermoanaerobaculia bacterium]|nr:hypothetical protein [Thermoanaerobaculia bacterium]
DAYFGNWEFVASELEGVFRSKARNTVGVELRLDTPLPGLQISAGEMDYKVVKEEEGGPIVSPSRSYHLSVEGTYRRLVTHVEYKYRHTADAKVDSGYVHVGYRLTDKLTANLQAEGSHVSLQELPQGIDQDMDRALGVSYTLRPGLVLKAEHHWNRGFSAVLPATGLAGPKLKTRYAILSLSTSF